jgi:hypothetical protein
VKYVSNAALLAKLETMELEIARLRRIDDSVAYLRARVERLLPENTRPWHPPVFENRPSLPLPMDPLPTPALPPSTGGGRYDSSLTFVEPFHRHEVLLVGGGTVRYTLPAGQAAAGFSVYTTPMYGPHEYGANPLMDRWVEDATGKVIVSEKDMGLSGTMSFGRTPGPLYLNLKPRDFTGWVFVEYQ